MVIPYSSKTSANSKNTLGTSVHEPAPFAFYKLLAPFSPLSYTSTTLRILWSKWDCIALTKRIQTNLVSLLLARQTCFTFNILYKVSPFEIRLRTWKIPLIFGIWYPLLSPFHLNHHSVPRLAMEWDSVNKIFFSPRPFQVLNFLPVCFAMAVSKLLKPKT